MNTITESGPLESRPIGPRPVQGRRRASAWTTQLTFIGRSLRHSYRNPEELIMAVALPVLLMLLFTYVFGGAIADDGAYVNYVVPGVILLCAGFGAASTAVAVCTDMTEGVINRFRTMPVRAPMVIGGHVVASLARNLLATSIVIGVAALIGFRPTTGLLGWLGVIGLVALYILAITTLFAAIGLVASSPAAANNYGFGVLFLPYLSSAFVPVDTMPGWLAPLAEHQPVTPIVETLRALLFQLPVEDGWTGLGWCVLILLASAAWAVWLFPRRGPS